MTGKMVEYDFSTSQIHLRVNQLQQDGCLDLSFKLESDHNCLLHWGLETRRGTWQRPPASTWPPQTVPYDHHAVQSLFIPNSQGFSAVKIHLEENQGWRNLPFVIYLPESKKWVKDGRNDFRIPLPRPVGSLSVNDVLSAYIEEDEWRQHSFNLGDDNLLVAAVSEQENALRVLLACDADAPLLLHWGGLPKDAHTNGSCHQLRHAQKARGSVVQKPFKHLLRTRMVFVGSR